MLAYSEYINDGIQKYKPYERSKSVRINGGQHGGAAQE